MRGRARARRRVVVVPTCTWLPPPTPCAEGVVAFSMEASDVGEVAFSRDASDVAFASAGTADAAADADDATESAAGADASRMYA